MQITSPAVEQGYIEEDRHKNNLYFHARSIEMSEDWEKYTKGKAQTQKSLRKAEWNYVTDILTDTLSNRDTKRFWRYIKWKRMDIVGTSSLEENNQLQSDNKRQSKINSNPWSDRETPPISCLWKELRSYPELPGLNITSKGVDKILSEIQLKKASGPNEIPTRILKETAGTSTICGSHIYTVTLLKPTYHQCLRRGTTMRQPTTGPYPSPVSAVKPRSMSSALISVAILTGVAIGHTSSMDAGWGTHVIYNYRGVITVNDLISYYDRKTQVDVAISDFSKAFDVARDECLLNKIQRRMPAE